MSEGASDGAAPPVARKVIHVDMDAFYASVEQRDNPSLRGKAIAVGGVRERGVVATASYEARRYGVRSAMPSARARRLCPDLIFIKPRFEVYAAVSRQIRAIFARYTPLVEPLSLDEAYLDVTDNLVGEPSATRIAEAIRAAIRAETGLTASAGVSYNKLIAKLASDQNKPDGLCVVTPADGPAFVAGLPVSRFHGVGPVTAARMNALGIVTGADLRDTPLEVLCRHFGKSGPWFHRLAHGDDPRPVSPDRKRKSIGSETTYFPDLTTPAACRSALADLVADVWRHTERLGARGRTVTMKLRYHDYVTLTRAHSLPAPVADRAGLAAAADALLETLMPPARGIRLLGVTLSNLDQPDDDDGHAAAQLELDLDPAIGWRSPSGDPADIPADSRTDTLAGDLTGDPAAIGGGPAPSGPAGALLGVAADAELPFAPDDQHARQDDDRRSDDDGLVGQVAEQPPAEQHRPDDRDIFERGDDRGVGIVVGARDDQLADAAGEPRPDQEDEVEGRRHHPGLERNGDE
jgi:DNA polymerase-4